MLTSELAGVPQSNAGFPFDLNAFGFGMTN